MALAIKINTVDKSSLIDWASVKWTQILTKEPDTFEFLIRNVPSKTYRPALSDVVQFYDGATLLFGGVVVQTDETVDGLVRYFSVVCKDYTQLMDAVLVSKTYTGQTATAIITDLISEFASTFTTTNVAAAVTIDSITFNYLTLSQCLQKIADALQGYDWYVDANKDIHFFLTSGNVAPFSLDDTSGNHVFGSLIFSADLSQLRNQITIRGGTVAGTAVDNQQECDGVQRIFFVGYNLSTFLAYKALAATPTTFVALTVGKDGIDNPASFDCLYNPDRGLLTFPDASKPAISDVLKYSGTPYFPLILQQQDSVSVATYGEYDYLIIDKTIVTKQQARDRASAEIIRYGTPLYKGSFRTYVSGLAQGQTITINSTIRGISGSFKIQRITTTLQVPTAGSNAGFIYDVDFVSTQSLTMIDVLNKLLVQNPSDQISIGANEVVDRVYSFPETITTADSLFNSALNYGTSFVLGAYTTNWAGGDTKRIFVLGNGRLG